MSTQTTHQHNSTVGLDADDLHDLLSSARRREVIRIVSQVGPIDKGDLVDRVAAAENGVEVGEVTSEQRSRVSVSLIQVHLDRLSEDGVIVYDSGSKIVNGGPELGRCAWYLENGPVRDHPADDGEGGEADAREGDETDRATRGGSFLSSLF